MERDHLEDKNIYRKIILKWNFKKKRGEALTGFLRLRIGNGSERLQMR